MSYPRVTVRLVKAGQDIAKIRELTNQAHATVQGAQVTGEPADILKLLLQVSDALLHVIGALEDVDLRMQAIERLRPSWTK
jgi:hypothetical protein